MKNIIVVTIIIVLFIAGGFYFTNQKRNTYQSQSQQTQMNEKEIFQDQSSIPAVSVISKDLSVPWAIAFLPDNRMLVTERKGTVRVIDTDGSVEPIPAATISVDTKLTGEGGLLGMVLHPNFIQNQYVYLYYTYQSQENQTLNRVVRMKFTDDKLMNEEILVDKIPGALYHNGGRIKFGPDGYLYITTGDSQEPSLAQNKNSLAGKILRVTDQGKAAPGNPFNNEVYSYGHRNPQGIAWNSSGQLWETEHGPSGIWPNCCQDEINKIEKGENYGWPESVGDTVQPGTIAPILHSGHDAWVPSGAAFIDNSFFFAGLKAQILYEAVIQNNRVVELKKHFTGEYGRFREVVVGPDGMLYLTTSNRDGRGFPYSNDDKIIKVNPNKL